MFRDFPEFMYDGKLTDAGRKVVEHIEATLDHALALVEGQNVTSLNQLSGPYQDYYVNVRCMTYYEHKPERWVKDRRAAVAAIWEQIAMQEAAALQAAQVDEKQTTLEAKLVKLEAMLADALKRLAEAEASAEPMPEPEENPEPTPEPEEPPAKKSSKKTKAEEAEPPAEPAAEGDDEEEEKAE